MITQNNLSRLKIFDFYSKINNSKKYKTKIIFKTNINSCLICYRDIKIFDELFTFSLFLFVCFQFKGNSMFVVGIYFSIVIHGYKDLKNTKKQLNV